MPPSDLSLAAYHIVPGFEHQGIGTNLVNSNAEEAYAFLPAGLRLLTAADLPSLAPISLPTDVTPNFPTIGIVNGIYLDGNAAALLARSANSLFIAISWHKRHCI